MLVVVHSEQLGILGVPLRAAHPQVGSARGRRRWRHWVLGQRLRVGVLGVRPRHLRSVPRTVRPVYSVHMLLSERGKRLGRVASRWSARLRRCRLERRSRLRPPPPRIEGIAA